MTCDNDLLLIIYILSHILNLFCFIFQTNILCISRQFIAAGATKLHVQRKLPWKFVAKLFNHQYYSRRLYNFGFIEILMKQSNKQEIYDLIIGFVLRKKEILNSQKSRAPS